MQGAMNTKEMLLGAMQALQARNAELEQEWNAVVQDTWPYPFLLCLPYV